MYVRYFNLRDRPFRMSPDPDFLYLSPVHREALAALNYSIGKMLGFVSLTGEVGTGKTMMLKAYLETTPREKVKAVYLYNPELSFEELVREMYRELALPSKPRDLSQAVRWLHTYLIRSYRKNRRVVVFVDEAHLLPVETLERLRILSNLESTKHKLLQIVLSGQPELDEILNLHELRQLKQRIAVSATLAPLTFDESVEYLKHRIERVATTDECPFEEKALRKIATYAKGIPRVLNTVAENALLSGYGQQVKPVTQRVVREVIRDLSKKDSARRDHRDVRVGDVVRSRVLLRTSPKGAAGNASNSGSALDSRSGSMAELESR